MNSEHRHELQQNALANVLGHWLKAIEPYTKIIAVLFAVGAVGVVAFSLADQSKTMDRSQATLNLLQNANAGDADALATISDQYGDTGAGMLARIYEADTNLSEGINGLYEDREEATTKIEDAITAYKAIVNNSTLNKKSLKARASFGLGHAYESLGKLKEATAAYQTTVELSSIDALSEAATQRIQMLGKAETKEFLAWFDAQDFKPADPAMPPTLPSGNVLPDLPDLDLPPVKGLNVPDELKATQGDAATTAPGEMKLPEGTATESATSSEPAATESPETEAADQPASEKMPAESPKAEATPEPAAPATEDAPKAADEPAAPAEKPASTEEPTKPAEEPAPSNDPPTEKPPT